MWSNMTNSTTPTAAPTKGSGCAPPEAEDTYILGVILGLAGSIAINTGNNIQSLGMHKLEDKRREEVEAAGGVFDPKEKIEPSKSKVWVFGTTVFLTGSLLNFWSYGFAPQSVLAALESIQFVTNILFGKFMLGATITKKMYIGTVLCIVGTIVVVVVMASIAKTVSEPPTIEDLMNLYGNYAYLAYIAIIVVGGVLIQMTHLHYQKMLDAGNPLAHSHLVLPITYAVFSALFGTMSVVQAKCLATILERNLTYCDAVFEHWFTYKCILVWLAFVVVWLYRMNEALSKYNPLFIIPLLQVNFIFFAMMSGGIYFREFDDVFFGVASSGGKVDAAEALSPTPSPKEEQSGVFGDLSFPGPPVAGYVIGCAVMFSGLFMLRPEVQAAVIVPMGSSEEPDEESPDHPKQPTAGTPESESARSRRSMKLLDSAVETASKVASQTAILTTKVTPRQDTTPRKDTNRSTAADSKESATDSAQAKDGKSDGDADTPVLQAESKSDAAGDVPRRLASIPDTAIGTPAGAFDFAPSTAESKGAAVRDTGSAAKSQRKYNVDAPKQRE